MAYKKGMIEVATAESIRKENPQMDPTDDPLSYAPPYAEQLPVVFLPHSCQEWVIGGPAEVRQMIEDLQAILPKLEKK